MKFNLKLFVLVGVLAGFRDVCGTEKDENFYVNDLVKGNQGLIDAVDGKRVIKAVYKTEEGGDVDIIYKDFKNNLSKVLVWDVKKVEDVGVEKLYEGVFSLWYNMSKDVEYTVYFIFNNENIGSTAYMFYWCESLISADFRFFNTTNVTDMSSMFWGCSSLTKLNLSNFNTTNVTVMSYMFCGCTALTKLDLSPFSTTNVTVMSYMFSDCSHLTELNLSSFKTEQVTNMSGMFSGCIALTKLDLSPFDTKNVTRMASMFSKCTSLKELNLVDFDFSNVGNMENMFLGCNFDKLFLRQKYKDIRNRYCCCGDEYVYINAKKVVEFNPNKVFFCEYDDLVTKEAAKLV